MRHKNSLLIKRRNRRGTGYKENGNPIIHYHDSDWSHYGIDHQVLKYTFPIIAVKVSEKNLNLNK